VERTPRTFFAAVVAVLVVLLAGCPRLPSLGDAKSTPTPSPTPEPTPPPPPYVPNKRTEIGRIFNGMQYRVILETDHGTTATHDRNDPASYVAELTFKAKIPKPHKELAEIEKLNPMLPRCSRN
jgi:hypothetical protein